MKRMTIMATALLAFTRLTSAQNDPKPMFKPFEATESSASAVSSAWLKQSIPNISTDLEGAGLNGIDGGTFTIFNSPTSALQQSTLRIQRKSNYSGGAGHNPYSLWSFCETTAGEADYLFCNNFDIDNHSTSTTANMVAAYFSAHKWRGAGPTWGSTFEVDDVNVSPTTAAVSAEFDMYANGADVNNARVIIDAVAAPTQIIPNAMPPVLYAGLRVGQQDRQTATFANGIFFNPGNYGTVINGTGPAAFGFDLSKFTINGAAVALTSSQKIAFDKDPSSGAFGRYLFAGGGNLYYHTPDGISHFAFQDSGNFTAAGFSETLKTPSSSSAPCDAGQFTDDANYHYVCIAASHWRRVALSDF